MNDLNGRDRLIVALDYPDAASAQRLISGLGETVRIYKVGKQLFTAEGPTFVRELLASGRGVFLDLKFHDIPNTAAAAVSQAARLGVTMLTVHASGGRAMLQAATEAATAAPHKPLVLAVTVLTSLTESDLHAMGVHGTPSDQVLRLAGIALKAGCGGVVASAQEAQLLRSEFGPGFAIVTPGIRPAGADAGDQARVVTASAAIRAGATHLVVGRPITAAADPVAAAQQMLADIASANAAPPRHL